MSRTIVFSTLIACCALLVAGSNCVAQISDAIGLASLSGITSVKVYVEDMRPELEADGLRKQQVQADIEQKLQAAGIKVSAANVWIDSAGKAELWVDVKVLKYSNTQYAYSIAVNVLQKVSLARVPPKESLATTWSTSTLGIVGASNMPTKIREQGRDQVSKFVSAYLLANPK